MPLNSMHHSSPAVPMCEMGIIGRIRAVLARHNHKMHQLSKSVNNWWISVAKPDGMRDEGRHPATKESQTFEFWEQWSRLIRVKTSKSSVALQHYLQPQWRWTLGAKSNYRRNIHNLEISLLWTLRAWCQEACSENVYLQHKPTQTMSHCNFWLSLSMS